MNILICSNNETNEDFFKKIVKELELHGDNVYYKFFSERKILPGTGISIFGIRDSFLKRMDCLIIDLSHLDNDLSFLMSNATLYNQKICAIYTKINPPEKIVKFFNKGKIPNLTLFEFEEKNLKGKVRYYTDECRKIVGSAMTDILIKIKIPRKAKDAILDYFNEKQSLDGENRTDKFESR